MLRLRGVDVRETTSVKAIGEFRPVPRRFACNANLRRPSAAAAARRSTAKKNVRECSPHRAAAVIFGTGSVVGRPKMDDIVLYDYWRSSASWRVRMALVLKGLARSVE